MLELPLGLTQRAGQLGQLGAAEDEQDDDEDDQEFRCSEAAHGCEHNWRRTETLGGSGGSPGVGRLSVLVSAINVSEGRSSAVIDALALAAAEDLLDVHTDAHHHRTVLTVVGEEAPQAVAAVAVDRIDLRHHSGVHPRLGSLDVVPFVPWGRTELDEAVAARDRFTRWLGTTMAVPAFSFGFGRPTLPEVRRQAFVALHPDAGPGRPHPTAGATAVGARLPLVAYNLWLAQFDPALARSLARSLRSPRVRALGLVVGGHVQVSCNLLEPSAIGPAEIYDSVVAVTPVARTELVGLVPEAVLAATDRTRWAELDLAEDRTVESRVGRRAAGL